MIINIADWEFDIDLQRTMAYSHAEALAHCDCAYCRNFYLAVDNAYPQLRAFLTQFGVDLEAPDELMPYDVDGRMLYEGTYVVFGRIRKPGKQGFAFGNASLLPMEEDGYDFEEPYFVLTLERIILPWMLDESLKDVVSPANEPFFIDKMMDHLLQIQDDTLIS